MRQADDILKPDCLTANAGLRLADIGIGADGSVWVIGSDECAGGYGIYTWDGHNWRKTRGSARQVSVGPDGNPWVVNREGEIYTRW